MHILCHLDLSNRPPPADGLYNCGLANQILFPFAIPSRVSVSRASGIPEDLHSCANPNLPFPLISTSAFRAMRDICSLHRLPPKCVLISYRRPTPSASCFFNSCSFSYSATRRCLKYWTCKMISLGTDITRATITSSAQVTKRNFRFRVRCNIDYLCLSFALNRLCEGLDSPSCWRSSVRS